MRSSAPNYRIDPHSGFYFREKRDDFATGSVRIFDSEGKSALAALSDRELIRRLDLINRRENRTAVSAVFHIAEIDERKLYLERGFSSMFEYCTGRLGYTGATAGRRVAVGRCINKYPLAGEMLANRETTPYIISLIAGVIDESNSAMLLEKIRGKTTAYVETVVLRKKPRPRVRDRIKKIYIKTQIGVDETDRSRHTGTGRGRSPGHSIPAGGSEGWKDIPVVPRAGSGSPPGRSGEKPARVTPRNGRGIPSGRAVEITTTATPGTGSGKDSGRSADAAEIELESICEREDGNKCENGSSNRSGKEDRQVLEEMYKFEFAVDAGFKEKFEHVRSLLSTKYPQKLELEKFFEILLDEYIDRHSPEARERRRAERGAKRNKISDTKSSFTHSSEGEMNRGLSGEGTIKITPGTGSEMPSVRSGETTTRVTPGTGSSRKSCSSSGGLNKTKAKKDSRHIPQALRDRVFLRDRGRCAYISPGGKRCGSRHNLQIDHIVPFALGGTTSIDNLQLLCQKHNLMKAEREFGKRFVKNKLNS